MNNFRKPIKPGEETISSRKLRSIDLEIEKSICILDGLTCEQFKFSNDLNEFKNTLKNNRYSKQIFICLDIFKLLYCLDYKEQMFLYLGIVVEFLLNDIADAYNDKNIIPANTLGNRDPKFYETFTKATLASKAGILSNVDLLGDNDTTNSISSLIRSVTPFRNLGGHAKDNLFFNIYLDKMENVDSQVVIVMNLIRQLIAAKEVVIINLSKP